MYKITKQKGYVMKQIPAINNLLQKPMDRREFFRYLGAAGVVVLGGGLIMRSLLEAMNISTGSDLKKSSSRSYGYGSEPYGGRQR